MTELLVGTKKGLFVLEGEPGARVRRDRASVRRRAGRVRASRPALRTDARVRHLAVLRPEDLVHRRPGTATGSRRRASRCPRRGDAALERIWVIVTGEEEGLLYAGGDPGVLFESRDGGSSFGLNRGLWEHPSRAQWQPGRRRALPALDRDLARRSRAAGGGDLRGRRVADRRRGCDMATRQRGLGRSLSAGRRARGRERAVRASRPQGGQASRAHVPAVPRRRLSLRRRRPIVGGHRRRPALGLRIPARARSGRRRQRVRDPARGRHGSRDARWPGAGVRDARRGRELDAPGRRPPA